MPVDKLVIANSSAMQAKYGAAGLAAIKAALAQLVAADAARGLNTLVLEIDNARQMGAHGGKAVAAPTDERGATAAVDVAFNALSPDYVLLLDGPDVVPHITLNAIAGLNDGDANIPSDLPYASGAGWSRQASNYLAITRVVGRLPAAEGDPTADHLVRLIEATANHQPQDVRNFQEPFGISAAVWQVSTQLSLSTTFGPGTPLHLCPPDGHPAINNGLASMAHLINCHGGQADPKFYGQQRNAYPTAIESQLVGPCITAGTFAVAECCFGAELYNNTMIQIDRPICMSYLLNGAVAFVGSTNIAYGPAASNAQADLLTQYFLQELLTGASSGAAMLLARQRFVQGQIMASPGNLKTVAQFILLGDPSVQPCAVAPAGQHVISADTTETEAKSIVSALSYQDVLAPEQNRKMRRLSMQGIGTALGASASKPGQEVELDRALRTRLTELARSQNIDPKAMTLLTTSGGAMYRSAAKAVAVNRRVAVVVDRTEATDGRPGPFVKVMVSHIVDDRIVRMEVSESR